MTSARSAFYLSLVFTSALAVSSFSCRSNSADALDAAAEHDAQNTEHDAQNTEYDGPRVVLVIIDGLRYSEGLGDPAATHVPRMAALATQGAIVEPFINDGSTWTIAAVPAIWTGAWTDMVPFSDPSCGGLDNVHSELPSVFEYFRRQLSRPSGDAVYFLGDVGCSWKASLHDDYGTSYWPTYHDDQGESDTEVWTHAREVLQASAPPLVILYLSDTDSAGHSGDWNRYIGAVETADQIVGEVWEFLADHPSYAGRTTLIVTNDHGRHLDGISDGFVGHGDDCAGCQLIQLLAIGPDIRPGLISDVPRSIPDIVPTMGAILGLDTEYATGQAMMELFKN